MISKKPSERKSKYIELLKNPQWQKKRLEILQRDNFSCRGCGDIENTLHVHHCYYSKDAMPWSYPDTSLITLCEECHECESGANIEKQALVHSIARHGFLGVDFNDLADAFYNAHLSLPNEVLNTVLRWVLQDPSLQHELIDRFSEKELAERKNV